jgi:hypothetical protein
MEEQMPEKVKVYDILAAGDKYKDHTGRERRRYTRAGVAFDPRDGGEGKNGKVNAGVALTGDFIIRERREKAAQMEDDDTGYDDGASCLEP